MKRLSLVTLCLVAALPVLAADNYTKGKAFYDSGQYGQALAYLQDTVSKKPRLWEGHYYLAHTYLALGQRAEAYQQYQTCQMCNPPADIAKACQKVEGQIASSTVRMTGGQNYASTSPTYQKYQNQHKQEIIDQGNREANRVQTDTMKPITDIINTHRELNTLDYYVSPEDKGHAKELQVQTQKRTDKIIETARKQARDLDK